MIHPATVLCNLVKVGYRSLQFAKVGCGASQISGKKCASGDRNHPDT